MPLVKDFPKAISINLIFFCISFWFLNYFSIFATEKTMIGVLDIPAEIIPIDLMQVMLP